nr:BREX system serine/threonine kinase PglW [Actinopolyspora biskrensis]
MALSEGLKGARVQSGRWVEVSPSQFTHEAEGLRLVKELLPDVEPFRAWSNFEFRDTHGRWHEVDLLVLGRDTLHLVELKYYNGRLRGDDHRWLRDGHRAEDSPLKLARRKAQYFATLLKTRLREHLRERGEHHVDVRDYVPFVQESVFLHHPNLSCELPAHSRQGLYGLDGHEASSGLAPISELLLAPAKHKPISKKNSGIVAALMEQIGLVQRRQREVGSWVIDDEPLGDGDGWQDWPAFHRVATTDRYRIRFHMPKPGSSSAEQRQLERRIEHEHRLLSRLRHDSLLTPRDIIKDELGVGLVYEDDQRLTRLDLWLADHGANLTLEQQLDLLRQVAEALNYAHRHRVVHRGLTPSAVSLRQRSDGDYAIVVANWDAAGRTSAAGQTSLSHTALPEAELSVSPLGAELTDEEQLFEAPEGRWSADADRIRLDVFALGMLAFYVLTNQGLPAQDRGGLVERIRRDSGLDLSAELPQSPSALRALVLHATDPRPSERTPTVTAFLEQLEAAAGALATPAAVEEDPLEARPGTELAGTFTYLRKLGSGSTAVGILVQDATAGDAVRVLKVAKDDAAAERLKAEAKVLGKLNHERIAQLSYLTSIGNRTALVLQHAGDSTLADELATKRGRLSLDLLERWGTDLLDALAALDRAGITHRDIKPSNLGVRKVGKTETRLVLFDFSMAGTESRALTAGTPPYLDPFLGEGERTSYDSAAERYGAAVVLYEMAAGKLPQYGPDPEANPASVAEDITVDGAAFDAAVREELEAFFHRALSRDVALRPDTAEDMRRDWSGIFRKLGRHADDTEDKVAAATLETTLAEAGLSARAISALEPASVGTVADLLSLDSVQLNRLLAKETKSTSEEIRKRARAWRKEFGRQLSGKRRAEPTSLADPIAAAGMLARTVNHPRRAASREKAARLILGLDEGLDPFAAQQEVAKAVGRSVPRGHQLIKELQDSWSKQDAPRNLLEHLVGLLGRTLNSLGGVATVQTLTSEVLAALPELPQESAKQGERAAAGLLRLALDRYNEHEIAETAEPLAKRRHGGRLALLAKEPVLLDAAEAAAQRAGELVTQATASGDFLVSQQRAAREIRTRFTRAFAAGSTDAEANPPAITDLRLVRLAAQTSRGAALSARGELHAADLPAATAVRLALAGLAETAELSPAELTARVRARFPQLGALPERPELDAVVDRSGVGLRFDDGAYRSPHAARSATTGLPSRVGTSVPAPSEATLSRGDYLGATLAESISARSFLALGVAVRRSDEADRAAHVLALRYGGTVLDVTGMLVDEMKTVAGQKGLPWDLVRGADAAQEGSRDAQGLHALLNKAFPAVGERLDAEVFSEGRAGAGPLILTELSPLARYGQLKMVARWSELAARRSRAVWVVLPQLSWMRGALVDSKPVQLGSNGQFVELDADWLATQEAETGAETDSAEGDGADSGSAEAGADERSQATR